MLTASIYQWPYGHRFDEPFESTIEVETNSAENLNLRTQSLTMFLITDLPVIVVREVVRAVVVDVHSRGRAPVPKVNHREDAPLVRCTKRHRSAEVAARDAALVVALRVATVEINHFPFGELICF